MQFINQMEKSNFHYYYLLIIPCFFVFSCSIKNKKDTTEIIKNEKDTTEIIKFPYHKTDLEELKLKGEVKSFQEYSYEAIDKFGELTKGKRQYDLGFKSYPIGALKTFNKNGYINKIIEYDENKIVSKTSNHSYNEKGNIIEINGLDSNDSLKYKIIFKYNDKDFMTVRSLYDKEGEISQKMVFEYNEELNQVGKSWYFFADKDELYSYDENKYDLKGNLKSIFTDFYDSLRISEKSYFTYDENGNLIKEEKSKSTKEGAFQAYTTYDYNDKGYVSNESSATYGLQYEYEYDAYTNWIKRIEYINGFPKFILERKIEYY